MKTATLPPLRVEPELRRSAERVLREDETLSSFVEQAVRESVERRTTQAAFIAKGLASAEAARKSATYVSAGSVLKKLEKRLTRAKAR
jgi:predicted transcriptional regulator